MYSFYGGKQGRSYKITAHFDSIWDMVQAFNRGGDYTDAQYDEYVIIDTVLRRNLKNNAENGILYRRGYDFNQAFNPHEIPLFPPKEPIIDPQTGEITTPTLQPNQLTEIAVDLWVDNYEQEYTYNWDSPKTTGNYKYTRKVPKYYDFHYKLHDSATLPCEIITGNSENNYFNLDRWNDDWEEFVTHPGGGAEYVGQIVGPEGDSPAVEILKWDEWRKYTQEEGAAEPIKGEVEVDPKPGYNADAKGKDGYDENGFHDKLQYGYCTIRDLKGNVQGCYIAFDIPYTVFNFEAKSITPYDSKGTYDPTTRTWSYQGLIEEDADSVNHKYYKHYHIDIPTGIHGANINELKVNDYKLPADEYHDKYLEYTIKDFDSNAGGIISEFKRLAPYKVIDDIEPIIKPNSDKYKYDDKEATYKYPEKLRIEYTQGGAESFDYSVIERIWIQFEDRQDSPSIGNLYKDHIYIMLSNGTRIDCGLFKKIDRVSKNSDDNNFYTYYNVGDPTPFPVAEIEAVKLQGDLLLVTYRNVPDSFYNGVPTYIEELPGGGTRKWINYGAITEGYHIYTNFVSEAALRAAFPYGFGRKPDGSEDPETKERAGWIATVSNNNMYKLYAYDYTVNDWYLIQDLGAAAVKPEYSVLLSTADAQGQPTDSNKNQLQINGLWFVITE